MTLLYHALMTQAIAPDRGEYAQFSFFVQLKPFEGRCPNLGLDDLTEDGADHILGRNTPAAELIARVKPARFVVSVGPLGGGRHLPPHLR